MLENYTVILKFGALYFGSFNFCEYIEHTLENYTVLLRFGALYIFFFNFCDYTYGRKLHSNTQIQRPLF